MGRIATHFYVIGQWAFIPLRGGLWLRTQASGEFEYPTRPKLR